jgi:hypothetical protein
VSGTIETVADGRWIILIGIFGWVGYLAEFGLIALPVLMLWLYKNRVGDIPHQRLIGPVTLLLAINLMDMLPNATLTPLTWLFAGAVLGLAESARRGALAPGERTAPAAGSRSRGWRPIM